MTAEERVWVADRAFEIYLRERHIRRFSILFRESVQRALLEWESTEGLSVPLKIISELGPSPSRFDLIKEGP